MKNDQKHPNDFLWLALTLSALAFIIIPWIINSFLMDWNIRTAEGLGNAEWLGFWGSYIGSALGVIVTILAFLLTFRQNLRQNLDIQAQNKLVQEQNKIILDQNDASKKLAEEQMRLQALPFINVTEESFDTSGYRLLFLDNDGQSVPEFQNSTYGFFSFINIGVAPAIGVRISSESIGHFSVSDRKVFQLRIPPTPGYIEVSITFEDRELRKYNQTLKLKAQPNGFVVKEITPPQLIAF